VSQIAQKKEGFLQELMKEWEHYAQKGAGAIKSTKDGVKSAKEDVTSFVKKYPFLSVTFAFLLGYFIGSVRRRK